MCMHACVLNHTNSWSGYVQATATADYTAHLARTTGSARGALLVLLLIGLHAVRCGFGACTRPTQFKVALPQLRILGLAVLAATGANRYVNARCLNFQPWESVSCGHAGCGLMSLRAGCALQQRTTGWPLQFKTSSGLPGAAIVGQTVDHVPSVGSQLVASQPAASAVADARLHPCSTRQRIGAHADR
jgi:hypothetical protein